MEWSNNGYLALSALNVKNGYIDPTIDAHFGNDELYEKWMEGNELSQGQVLFTTEAPMGNVAQVPDNKKYILSQRTIAFCVNDTMITDNFLAILLRSPKVFADLEAFSSGGTAKGISQKSLENLIVILPKLLDEQTKIGNFFKQLDETIALHKRKLAKLLILKSTFLTSILCTKNIQIYTPNPISWEQRKLGEIVDFYSGLTYSPNNIVEQGTLVLRSSNVKENQIVTNDSLFVNSTFINVDNVNEGDIIVVVRNGSRDLIGKHAKIRQAMPNTVIGAFMTGIRFEQPDFLTALLDTNQFNQEIEKNLGATINQITINSFKNMVFHIPFKLEQAQIGNFFKQLDETIALHKRKQRKYQQIKQIFLRKMLID